MIALLLTLALCAGAPERLPVYLVQAADQPWSAERAATAVAAMAETLAWWQLRTGDAAPALAAPVALTVANPYDRTSYMDASAPGAYLVARAAGGPTLPNGRSGWARPCGWRLAAIETPARADATLAALFAHEWGHAAYGLPDVETRGDVMGPDYPQAYTAGRLGCASGALLAHPCVYLPLVRP